MLMDLGTVTQRYHRAFNDRDFAVWREVFDDDVDLIIDGIRFHGSDAAVGYGLGSVTQFPGLHIASERIVADIGDTVVVEIDLVNGDPAAGTSRRQGTACEICRVRDGRIVSVRSYYMAEPAGEQDAVRVPLRAEAALLAEEQAALRRVATLVARGVSQSELFTAVIQEVGWMIAADQTALMRFEPDDTVTLVAAWSAADADLPIGSNRRLDDGLRVMRNAGLQSRWGPADLPDGGPFVDEARALGICTFVGVPVVVEGHIWGFVFASSTQEQEFASDAEARIAGFTELVATAIANAQSRATLGRLLDEQAALRRVATLVAQGVPPSEILSAVSDEVGRLLGVPAGVLRFESDGEAVVFVGVSQDLGIAVGTRWAFEPGMATAQVYRTGRSGRVDVRDWLASSSSPVAVAARQLGTVSTVASPIVVEGHLWGAMTVSSRERVLPVDTEERLEEFTELVATALVNAESREALAASRRRIVAASDEARRQIERDLHDGTQQRLVAFALTARDVEARIPAEMPEIRAELSRLATGLTDAIADVQELSRGIHPSILSQGGLGPALHTLARRSPVPVELDVATPGRFPEQIEVAVYYVASESLANATKHAQASLIEVSLVRRNATLVLSIRDDGIGGADPERGSGLVGLTDRVEALGGSIDVRSRSGTGTEIVAELPLGHG